MDSILSNKNQCGTIAPNLTESKIFKNSTIFVISKNQFKNFVQSAKIKLFYIIFITRLAQHFPDI